MKSGSQNSVCSTVQNGGTGRGKRRLEISEKWTEHFLAGDLTAHPTVTGVKKVRKKKKEDWFNFCSQYYMISDI